VNGEEPWFGIAWWVWASGCPAVGIVYLLLDEPAADAGLPGWWLRWGHGLCWALLAGSFVLRMTPWAPLASAVAAAGGLLYLVYFVLKLGTPSQP